MKQAFVFRAAIAFGAALLSLSFSAGATAAEKVEWNLSTWGNPRAWTKSFEAIAAEVEEKSGGNFTVTIHYGGTISPPKENLDGVSLGAFEMAQTTTSYHPGKNPIGTVLDLPFLPLKNWNVLVTTHDTFQDYEPWMKELARWNAVSLYANVLPQYEFMGVGEPPRKLDDWNGMRVRALGGIGDAMRRLGSVPTTVPAPEVYTSLERGVVQAASFPYSYTFGAFRIHEVGRWFTEGLQPGTVHTPIIMNRDAYESLPDEYKQLLQDAVPAAYDTLKAAYAEADEKWIPIYKERMEVVTYTPEQHQQFKELAAQPVWDEWVAQHKDRFDSQAVLDFVLETAAKAAEGS